MRTATENGKPPAGCNRTEGKEGIAKYHTGRPCVAYYEGKGVLLQASTMAGNPTGVGGGPRGEIHGWSKASRRRMRYFLLTRTVPEAACYGVTLTVPGPVLPLATYRELFKSWCREVDRKGWSTIWRAEVQKRGALHWHCIVWIQTAEERKEHIHNLRWSWFDALRSLGAFTYDPPVPIGKTGRTMNYVSNLTGWPGAWDYSIDVQDDGNAGNWLRYLQDHATKAKQEQIGENIGRHWGVVGRKRFAVLDEDAQTEFTRGQYHRFVRLYQRLCTPRIECHKAPFGVKLGYRLGRGSRGTSVWFSRVETVQRLAQWVISEHAEQEKRMFVPRKGGSCHA